MREILFRAKRIDNGEWVEGSYSYTFNENKTCPIVGIMAENHWIVEKDGNLVLIDKNTICQFTGLIDKNGNKIWENDVLRGHGNPKDLAKVVFGEFYVIEVESLENIDSVIGWHTEVIPTDALSKCEPFCLPMPLKDFYIVRSEFEVIGNIFDNPELLEGGGE